MTSRAPKRPSSVVGVPYNQVLMAQRRQAENQKLLQFLKIKSQVSMQEVMWKLNWEMDTSINMRKRVLLWSANGWHHQPKTPNPVPVPTLTGGHGFRFIAIITCTISMQWICNLHQIPCPERLFVDHFSSPLLSYNFPGLRKGYGCRINFKQGLVVQ